MPSRLLLFFLLVGSTLYSQQPRAADKPKDLCRIDGRIVNAVTGEPVGKARVTLLSGSGARVGGTSSDDKGHFLFADIPSGNYRLGAERPGFLTRTYGSTIAGRDTERGRHGTLLNLSPGNHLRDVEFKILPQGVIAGKVTDEDGEPFPRATVTVYSLAWAGSSPQDYDSTLTNDIGEFRLANLTSGRYLLHVVSNGSVFGNTDNDPQRGKDRAQDYRQTCYPSATDVADAAVIGVAAGQEVSGIVIPLRKEALYRVQGKLAGGGSAASACGQVAVYLTARSSQACTWASSRTARLDPDGSFEFPRVFPGAYHVFAQAALSPAQPGCSDILGRVDVDVVSGDIADLILPVGQSVQVSGAVKVEGQENQNFQSEVAFRLTSIELQLSLSPFVVAKDGTLKPQAVRPDRYFLNFSRLPANTYVKSVRMRNQEVLDKGIDLTDAQSGIDLEVVLSNKAATIQGTVRAGDEPASDAFVLLFADPVRPAQPHLNKTANVDQNGRFSFTGVAPGNYKLYALEEAHPELSKEAQAFEAFSDKAVKLHVEEGGTGLVQLSTLKPEDPQGK